MWRFFFFLTCDCHKLLVASLVIFNWCLCVMVFVLVFVTYLGLIVPKFENGFLKLDPNAGKALAEQ